MKRIIYQIDPKRRKPDGTFPEFVFRSKMQKSHQIRWLSEIFRNKNHNAGKKKIPFALSFRYFINFCRLTNYHILRGQASAGMTIDRIDNLKGYTDDNIQMLSNRENVQKYHRQDRQRGVG